MKNFFSQKKYSYVAGAIIVALILAGSLFWLFSGMNKGDWRGLIEKAINISKGQSELKIGFSNDWEYGERKRLKHKLTGQAPVELQKAVDFFNNEFKPDLVVGGGDYIESSSVKKDDAKLQLTEINNIFKKLEAPRLYALGNHDMRSLTKSEVREILGIPENHAFQDIGTWRVVVMDTNFNKEDDSDRSEKNYVTGYVSKEELAWLRGALVTDKPVIVFSHHSPIAPPREDGLTSVKNITNDDEVRNVLEERGNVAVVISGHNPQSHYEEKNGIHYVVVDTLVNESALGSFATINLKYVQSKKYAEMKIEQKGAQPRQYSFDWHYGAKEKGALTDVKPETSEESEPQAIEEGE